MARRSIDLVHRVTDCSVWIKVSIVAILLGNASSAVGYFTNYWAASEHTNFGIWYYCNATIGCSIANHITVGVSEWYEAIRGVITVAFLGMAVTALPLLVYMCMPLFSRKNKILLTSILIPCLVSCVCFFIGGGLFFSELPKPYELSYSYLAMFIAFALDVTTAFMLIMEMSLFSDSNTYNVDQYGSNTALTHH